LDPAFWVGFMLTNQIWPFQRAGQYISTRQGRKSTVNSAEQVSIHDEDDRLN